MNKSELIAILKHLIVTWTTQHFSGTYTAPRPVEGEEFPDPPPPDSETQNIYTLLDDVIPDGIELKQVDDKNKLVVYDLIFGEAKTVNLNDPYYFGLEVNGTIDPDFSIGMIFRGEELPDLTDHRDMMLDKVNKFKYKFDTLLNVSIEDWKQMSAENLAFVCKSDYNITVSDDVMYGENAVSDMIKILKKEFIQQTMRGATTPAEHRDVMLKKTVELLGVNVEDCTDVNEDTLTDVRNKWLNVIRKYRNNALVALDEEEAVAVTEDDKLGIEEIGVIKQMLKDLPKDVDYLKDKTSVKDIIDFWPALLLPRPEKIEVADDVLV